MDTKTMIEIFGYIGSALVVISMLMSSIVKLRIINTVGSVISGTYAVICGAIPLAVMNVCLIAINGYNLIKLLKTKQVYDLVTGNTDGALVKYFLSRYDSDIKQYFPGYDASRIEGKQAYIVCCEGNPAGMMIGEERGGIFDILIDYSTPVYRDCSVAKYLYSRLPENGVDSLKFGEKLSGEHESYLGKMGYAEENGAYVKKLA